MDTKSAQGSSKPAAPPTLSKISHQATGYFVDSLFPPRNPSAGSPGEQRSIWLPPASSIGPSGNNLILNRADDEKRSMSGVGDGSGGGKANEGGRSGSSSSDASRSSGAQRPPPHVNPSRRQPGRNTFQTPPSSFYPPADGSFQNSNAGGQPQQPPPQYTASHGTPYSPRGGFVGQYTMSPQPPMPMVTSQHQYAYSHPIHHPGLHSPDANMTPPFPAMNYSSGSLAPPQVRALYPYQRYSPDGTSATSPHFPGLSSNPDQPGSSAYDHSPPSNSPHSTHSLSPSGPYQVQHPSASFNSMHYPTMTAVPQFPASFPHSTPPVYQSQYPPSYPPYMPSTSEDGHSQQGGTWWYIPPAASPTGPGPGQYDNSPRSFQGIYPMPYSPVGRSDVDQYGNPTTFQSSPIHQSSHPAALGLPHRPVSTPSSARESSIRGPASPLSTGKPISDPTPGSGAGTAASSSERAAALRRPYHPNPPAHRSEWVMWVGNVPSDATHDELWRFFNQPPVSAPVASRPSPLHLPSGLLSPDGEPFPEQPIWGGVSSIFLISRSNCAFVNFEQEANLEQAVKRFNGLALRPNDPRCPRLVCRVRRRDDDLKAGVGGQRGMGMHTRWVKEQKERAEQAARDEADSVEEPPTTPSEHDAPSMSPGASPHSSRARAVSSDGSGRLPRGVDGQSPVHKSSSSGSYASTNSSFLGRNFPKRYFILKSLTEYDLNLSVERGVWATQPHNEGILNQAFRTSSDVFLIFGANKSGEFFGYARMSGPISRTEERVSWASRADSTSHSPSASISSVPGRGSGVGETIPEEDNPSSPAERQDGRSSRPLLFSPGEQRLADESPGILTPGEEQRLQRARETSAEPVASPLAHPIDTNVSPGLTHPQRSLYSAPAEVYRPHRRITSPKGVNEGLTLDSFKSPFARTTDPSVVRADFILDPQAPIRKQEAKGSSGAEAVEDEDGVRRKDTLVNPQELRQRSEPIGGNREVDDAQEFGGAEGRGVETWGTPFRVEWVHTDHLPFYRTRHLRNPWNHDREVKVSRDGTELEPTVGQMLLDEWEKSEQAPSPPASPGVRRGSGMRTQFRAGTSEASMPSIQRVLFKSQGGRPPQEDAGGSGRS